MSSIQNNYYVTKGLKDQYVTDYVDGHQVIGPLRWKRESGIPYGYFHNLDPCPTNNATSVMVIIALIIILSILYQVIL